MSPVRRALWQKYHQEPEVLSSPNDYISIMLKHLRRRRGQHGCDETIARDFACNTMFPKIVSAAALSSRLKAG